jgi:small GTP-binding protein
MFTKIVLAGEPNVGKTCICSRYFFNTYKEPTDSTVCVAYNKKTVILEDGSTLTLNVWDTAGQERFRSIISLYFKKVDTVILVFDRTNPDSFHQLSTTLTTIKNTAITDPIFLLVENKIDCASACTAEVETFAKENNMTHFKTSAKTGEGIDQIFEHITNVSKRHEIKRMYISKQQEKQQTCCSQS